MVYLVTSLTQNGQLAEIFLPEYHNLNVRNKGLGFKALNVVINRMVAFGSIIILGVFIFAPFFISLLVPGFSSEDKEEATLIFRVLLPYLYLQVINSFFKIVMNAEKIYCRPEFLQIINGTMSYWVYTRTKDSLKYNFLNKVNGIGFILIVIAILVKLKSSDLLISDFTNLNFFILGFITFLLALYPIFNTYKVFKK